MIAGRKCGDEGMAVKMQRIGVVGASSLLGKELSDELGESTLSAAELVLLDEEVVEGQLASAGDEASFIQKLTATSFDGLDFAFFAGTADETKEQWKVARRAGATIVDMTDALEAEPGVLVRAPWLRALLPTGGGTGGVAPDLNTAAVVVADAVALMLALVVVRIHAKLPVTTVVATVMAPASEYGRAAMDELHQQTVSLLSFHDLPREQYDAQVAFNLVPGFGEEAKIRFAEVERRIARHYLAITCGLLPRLELQMVHAPVFHGHTASVLVELKDAASIAQVEEALAGEHVEVVTEESDPPSNLSAAGQRSVLARVRAASSGESTGRRFWLWLATDNLKLAAANAIACAVELKRLRPTGKVQ